MATSRSAERRGGGASSRDVAGSVGAESMTLRVWRYGPGHEMAYHRHGNQEEVYQLISGGPQEVMVEGEVVTVQDGDWLRFAKDTPRRIQNHSDREAVWLTIGAPARARHHGRHPARPRDRAGDPAHVTFPSAG